MAFWRPGPNLWFGVRLPWTLADPWIWNKSWRLASRLLMVMGITVLISWRAFFISTAHLVGLSCLYTVILYRWKYGTWRFWKTRGWINFRPVVRCDQCGNLQKLDSHADLQGSCESCDAKLPERQVGIKALWHLGLSKARGLGKRLQLLKAGHAPLSRHTRSDWWSQSAAIKRSELKKGLAYGTKTLGRTF